MCSEGTERFMITCHMICGTWINYPFVWGGVKTSFTWLCQSTNRSRCFQCFLILWIFSKLLCCHCDDLVWGVWRCSSIRCSNIGSLISPIPIMEFLAVLLGMASLMAVKTHNSTWIIATIFKCPVSAPIIHPPCILCISSFCNKNIGVLRRRDILSS